MAFGRHVLGQLGPLALPADELRRVAAVFLDAYEHADLPTRRHEAALTLMRQATGIVRVYEPKDCRTAAR